MFCFGTISFVADEEGTLHRIADPLKKKPSLKIPKKARTKQEIAQALALRAKSGSCEPRAESSFTRRTMLSTSSTEKWTRITRKKETKTRQAVLLVPPPSKETQKEACHHDNSILPRRPLHRGESGTVPHLLRRIQLCLGKNHLSGKLADEGTDAITPGDIMKPENKIRRSLYRETISRRWEKLQMNESSGKGGTPADMIVGKLKSKPSRKRDNVERTLSSDET
jgi:hypothetical protein